MSKYIDLGIQLFKHDQVEYINLDRTIFEKHIYEVDHIMNLFRIRRLKYASAKLRHKKPPTIACL